MRYLPSGKSSLFFNLPSLDVLRDHLKIKPYSQIFLLVDSNTERHCYPFFQKHFPEAKEWNLIQIPAGETHKHLSTCMEVWQELSERQCDRKSLLVNLGGGVVTDLGGFVAATFKRGIDFINIPTSLLAMVDASVGGKTGVDLNGLKNQIGVMKLPKMVIILSEFLSTLPEEELRSGYAEMLKHALILDSEYWDTLKNYTLDTETLKSHIYHSVELKKRIVEEDPKEKGVRKILNFGHTLGHAIETFFMEQPEKQRVLHGEAIAAGMIMEAYLSHELCGLSKESLLEIKTVIQSIYPQIALKEKDFAGIRELLVHDKKNAHGKTNFSLISSIGKAVYDQQVPDELLKHAFVYYLD